GNGQQSNFGRGGMGGDRLLVECQDYNGRNNSDMSTPSDGMSPRMQLYLWDGPSSASLALQPIGLMPPVETADFGPQSFNTSGTVAVASDGTGSTLGCNAITSNVSGQVALIDRGACSFKQKAVNAQAAGAIAMLLVDDMAAPGPPHMGDGAPNTTVTI